MEQQTEQTLSEVSGIRAYIEKQWLYLMAISMTMGFSGGFTLGPFLEKNYPGHRAAITGSIDAVVIVAEVTLIAILAVRTRRATRAIRAQREQIVTNFHAQVDELLPHDPIQAARIKMQMEAQCPRL